MIRISSQELAFGAVSKLAEWVCPPWVTVYR